MVPFALASLVTAPPVDPTAARITAELSRALQARDLDWCERHLAKGFVYIGLRGDRQSRDWMLGRLRTWFHPLVYRVEASLALVSSRPTADGLLGVGDLVVRSRPYALWRTPLTVTTERVEARWRRSAGRWTMDRLREIGVTKVVDGKTVEGD